MPRPSWIGFPRAVYTITADHTVVNAANAANTGFTFAGAELGTTYNYTVTSSGGIGSVTGSGTITSATQDITGINVSTLSDGTLTYSVTLTDSAGNTGPAANATATLHQTAPSGYTITADFTIINAANASNTGFTFAGAEVGATYNYTVTSSGGIGSVTGSGAVSNATQDITGVNVSTLSDGTLTYSVTLTDVYGNTGPAANATATLHQTAPSGYTITADFTIINAANAANTGFTFANATANTTYSYTVTSSGGIGSVTGSGAITSATQHITGINVSTLSDGTLTYSVTLTNSDGNTGPAANATATLHQTAPSGYTITADFTIINAANASNAGFTFAGAEVGATYNYTVTSSGGIGSVTGSGSVSNATQDITGVNVSTLSDGTLTYSVTLTDVYGNTGLAANTTATLHQAAPSGYTITADYAYITAANAANTGFTFANATANTTYSYTVTSSGGIGSVTGNGAVTSATQDITGINVSTLSDGTLTYSVTLTNSDGNTGPAANATATLHQTAPSGYTITADFTIINAANAANTGFTFANATANTTYSYTVTSSGGIGSVTGSGAITSATQHITGINVSTLSDGTLTYSVTLTNSDGNTGPAANATATLHQTAPSGYTITADFTIINAANASNAGFTFAGAEVGATYNYTVTSSGGIGSVTGSGSVSNATQDITGVNVSTLSDGTLTYSVTLTDVYGNTGLAANTTATLHQAAPSGYTITADYAYITAANAANTGFTFANATANTTYSYTVTSSGGIGSVTGNGAVTSATQDITGINVSTLSDGTLTYSVTLTNSDGNTGPAANATATLHQTAPSGYTITADFTIINAANAANTGFTFANATANTTYSYTVTSSGGIGSVTGNGAVTSATQDITGINVSTLADGTLTYSVTLTDSEGNTGPAANATATLHQTAPSGYTITADFTIINAANAANTGFTFANATANTTYSYTVTSSGGIGSVTGNGAVTSATQDITGINVSTLSDGTLTYSVTLTDVYGNTGPAANATATLHQTAPSGYTITADYAYINAANAANTGFTFADATANTTYSYTVTSSGGIGSVTGNGAVTSATDDITGIDVSTLADGTLTYSVTLTDVYGNTGPAANATAILDRVAPSGYTIAADHAYINAANASNAGFTITDGEANATYNYTITSSGGGSLGGSGTLSNATQDITGVDVSSLIDGTLTYSVTLTDPAGNTGPAANATAILDRVAPSGYTITVDYSFINAANASNAGFTITDGEANATYNYTITSSGGGSLGGSGTLSNATQHITGVNVSTLSDGTLTYSVTLTDPAGNTGPAANDTATLYQAAPSGYTIVADDPIINANGPFTTGFTFTNAEVGATYHYTVSSSGNGSDTLTGNGSITSDIQDITGIDIISLPDGTLTFTVWLTNVEGNTGPAANATAILDTDAPSGYTITADVDPINAANAANTGFTITDAEIGTTYNYTITTSGGSETLSGNGAITATTQDITGINIMSLSDGTITITVTLTDSVGNTGPEVADTATLKKTAPSGYTITADVDPINAANAANAGFTIAAAEIGTTYDYTITTSGGSETLSGNGAITSATQDITGINVSSLSDGTLTFTVTLTDSVGNTGVEATDTATLRKTAPSGYVITADVDPINAANAANTGFTIAAAEIGTTYNYTITTDGGSETLSGNGAITSATQDITGINVSSLSDGMLTFTVTLTDSVGNTGVEATNTATLKKTAPSGYTITADVDPINAANAANTGFTIAAAEIGTTYNYTITTSGGSETLSGNGAIIATTQDITGINVSSLSDGTLTFTVTLTDSVGNTGVEATDTATLSKTAPSGYTITADHSIYYSTTAANTGFTFSGAQIGTTYAYTVTSTGGGTAVTGSGTITSATQDITGINVSSLGNGTLTYSVTLTDPAGNTGDPATATATLDQAAPAGYTIAADLDVVGASGVSSLGFTFTGATVGATYDYTIASSGGGSIVGSGTVASATQDVTGIDGSTLSDGTLTYSLTLTDAGHTGPTVTATATLDRLAPEGYGLYALSDVYGSSTASSAGFLIYGVVSGQTYSYTVTSSGGGSVTGSGTASDTTVSLSLDLSSLSDGTITIAVQMTDSGHTGATVRATATLDHLAPDSYSIMPSSWYIGAANASNTALMLSAGNVGSTYSYTVASTGGGGTVTGNGTVTMSDQTISGIDVSSLNDGTLTFTLTLTKDGHTGPEATTTATLDTVAPSGYTILADDDPITGATATNTGFTFSGAETGTTYDYTITTDGGSETLSGNGTITDANQDITGIDVSSLSDGTLTISVTLTDQAGNVGDAALAYPVLDRS